MKYSSWVYGIQSGLFIKIGVAGNIAIRLKQMNLYNPHPCKVVARRRTEYAYLVEKRLHQVLAPYGIGREWFMIDAKLVRAAMTVVTRDIRAEQIAWQIESAIKSEAKEAQRTARVLDVASRHVRRRRVNNIVISQMVERLAP